MFLTTAALKTRHLVRAPDAPTAGRFVVYHVCVNNQPRGVLPSWRLLEFLRGLKILNVHRKLSELRDGDFFEFSGYVHGKPLHLAVKTAEWTIFSNPGFAPSEGGL